MFRNNGFVSKPAPHSLAFDGKSRHECPNENEFEVVVWPDSLLMDILHSEARRSRANSAGKWFGETPETLHVLVLFGAVAAPVIFTFLSRTGAMFWIFRSLLAKSTTPEMHTISSSYIRVRHIVGVPGHVGEGPDPVRDN